MDNETRSKTLDKIRDRLAEFREKHTEAAKTYYEKKAEYDLELSSHLHENRKMPSSKTDLTDAYRNTQEGSVLWTEYHVAKADMEGLDRELKNLDAQRSIIQTQMKS